MNGFYILIGATGLIAILITYFLARFFKEKLMVKFIPAIISALAGVGFYIKSMVFSTGFEDLGYIILTIIAGIVAFVSLVTALIIGLIQRKT